LQTYNIKEREGEEKEREREREREKKESSLFVGNIVGTNAALDRSSRTRLVMLTVDLDVR